MSRIFAFLILLSATPAVAGDWIDDRIAQQRHVELVSRLNGIEDAIRDLKPKTGPKISKEQADAFFKRLMDDVAKKQAASRNCTGLCPSEY